MAMFSGGISTVQASTAMLSVTLISLTKLLITGRRSMNMLPR